MGDTELNRFPETRPLLGRDGNRILDVLLGNDGAQQKRVGYSGTVKDPTTGATTATGAFTDVIQNTGGNHVAVLLAATSPTATPSAANSALLVQDGGITIGTGKEIRPGGAAGTATQVLHGGASPAWGSVATDDIAANAVTQAAKSVGVTSGPMTASTSYVTLNGDGTSSELRVDLTTTGGPVIVLLVGTYSEATAGHSVFQAISLDGAAEVGEQVSTGPVAGYLMTMASWELFTGLAAGAHIFRGRWKTDAGTATASTTRRRLLAVELKR